MPVWPAILSSAPADPVDGQALRERIGNTDTKQVAEAIGTRPPPPRCRSGLFRATASNNSGPERSLPPLRRPGGFGQRRQPGSSDPLAADDRRVPVPVGEAAPPVAIRAWSPRRRCRLRHGQRRRVSANRGAQRNSGGYNLRRVPVRSPENLRNGESTGIRNVSAREGQRGPAGDRGSRGQILSIGSNGWIGPVAGLPRISVEPSPISPSSWTRVPWQPGKRPPRQRNTRLPSSTESRR